MRKEVKLKLILGVTMLAAVFLVSDLKGEENKIPLNELYPRNFDESKVPVYTLPDPLVSENGTVIDTPELWENLRRPEIKKLLETEMYGVAPGKLDDIRAEMISEKTLEHSVLQQMKISFIKGERTLSFNVLFFLPRNVKKPYPVLLGINFKGNHTVTDDPSVIMETPRFVVSGVTNQNTPVLERGSYKSRWPMEELNKRGIAVVTFARESVLVDAMEADFESGVFGLFPGKRKPTDWGLMAAWAWSMSRVIDYIETRSDFDKTRIAAIGTSRLGKATLWAGAVDERIKVTIANVAGKGGSSLLKRNFGVSAPEATLVKTQRHCDNFRKWGNQVEAMPFDSHFAIALVAPRALYVSHAEEDLMADPKGGYLALQAANPVFRLLGSEGLKTESLPAVESPVFSKVGMHIRKGKHGIEYYDWEQYFIFLDKYL